MMPWIYIAIVAYTLNAIAFVIDKHLLSAPILRPISYAFWVSILSLAVVVVAPFGVYWVNPNYFLIAFVSGASFFFALIFLYKAIKKTDVSVASTNVGVLGVIFTYIFSVLILGDSMSLHHVTALGLMVAGILFLGKAGKGIWIEALISGIVFGLSTVLLKFTFNNSTFLNGFFWTRIGLVGMALLSLLVPFVRIDVFSSLRGSPKASRFIFVLNKIIASVGFALLYVAIKLGNVSVVNALLGVQFALIFVLAFIFRNKIPGVVEDVSGMVLVKKIAGIILIGGGLLMFFK